MIAAVTLIFHPDNRLYFATQVHRAADPDEVRRWENQGYIVRQVEVDLPDIQNAADKP